MKLLSDFELLAAAERALAEQVGPMARILVRRAAQVAESAGELCRTLSLEIADPSQRATFLAAMSDIVRDRPSEPTLLPTGAEDATAARAMLKEEELRQAEADLAQFVGPIARILVRRAAPLAGTRDQLYRLLAHEIDDGAERRRFLLRHF